jgi:hypothetical protein
MLILCHDITVHFRVIVGRMINDCAQRGLAVILWKGSSTYSPRRVGYAGFHMLRYAVAN